MRFAEMINEGNTNSDELAAIALLVADRAEGEHSASKLSSDAFIDIANKMGLSLTRETLLDLVERGELSDIIVNANDEEITFKGKQDIDPTATTVDDARDTVKQMAKRQIKK